MKTYRHGAFVLAALLIAGLLAGQRAPASHRPTAFSVQLWPLDTKYRAPVFAADPGDGTGRLFIVEKRGIIKPVIDGVPSVHPFLDIRRLVRSSGAEQGLLSLAFHPRYRSTGSFFVAYTDTSNDLVVARYEVSSRNANRADPDSGRILLVAEKQRPDHNGGLVRFGPDGYLYVGVGDGGAGAEPEGNAQRLDSLLGKILRLDVDRVTDNSAYSIPPDNPFVGVASARPEIWAYGLRNPWRFSFDWETGDIFIGDVGFGGPEEVNVQSAGGKGINYGWNVFEGTRCYHPTNEMTCSNPSLTPPVWSYEHAGTGCAVVGGHVYRGTALPELFGAYVFGDYCSGTIWTMRRVNSEWRVVEFLDTDYVISSFAEDTDGELYVIDLNGAVLSLIPASSSEGVQVVS